MLTAQGREWVTGDRRPFRLALVVAAALGATMLLVVAINRWAVPSDEHAYWLAARRLVEGLPLYDATATAVTPYAFWYPPIVAQALAPLAIALPAFAFSALWTALMLACLFWLAGRNLLVAMALVAFPPVAVEFWFRNVHLILAVLVVLAIRRHPVFFAIGAAIKIGPGIGLAYLAATRRWRALAVTTLVGVALFAVSVALSPAAWRDYLEILLSRGPLDVAGFLPVPYVGRVLAAVALATVAARVRPTIGRPLLVVAVTVALPTLWFTALSLLVAIVPLARHPNRSAGLDSRAS